MSLFTLFFDFRSHKIPPPDPVQVRSFWSTFKTQKRQIFFDFKFDISFQGDQPGCPAGAGDRHCPPLPLAAPQDGLAQVLGLAFLGQKNSGYFLVALILFIKVISCQTLRKKVFCRILNKTKKSVAKIQAEDKTLYIQVN